MAARMKPARFTVPVTVRVLGWLLLVLVALAVVTGRQSVGVAREQALREVRAERAILDAERMELERRIQKASTRARVVRVARERLGMRLPADDEIVLLPVAADSAPPPALARRP
jgi:cell division protein FtsL